jgi:hypothetical protein
VLRRVFGPKRQEEKWSCIKVPDEERRMFPPQAIGSNQITQNVIHGKRVNHVREEKYTGPEGFGRCNEGTRPLSDQGTDGKIILGLIKNK